jgi:hypothetical protein
MNLLRDRILYPQAIIVKSAIDYRGALPYRIATLTLEVSAKLSASRQHILRPNILIYHQDRSVGDCYLLQQLSNRHRQIARI